MIRFTTEGYPECECEWCGCSVDDINPCESCWTRKAIDLLAKYEDVKMTPEEIEKMKEENKRLRARKPQWVPREIKSLRFYKDGENGIQPAESARETVWKVDF